MKKYWELVRLKIDGMLLRERVMIFAAVAFVTISLTSTMLLNPLLAKQKVLSAQLLQQQEKMKALQAQIQTALLSKKEDGSSPLRARLSQLQQQLQTQDEYLKSISGRMVEPTEMVGMLKKVLGKNGKLQLVALETFPVSPVTTQATNSKSDHNQIFKHSIEITLRGGYLDLLQYLSEVEKSPVQLYWAKVSFSVAEYPNGVFILNLYTLSLNKTWLQV